MIAQNFKINWKQEKWILVIIIIIDRREEFFLKKTLFVADAWKYNSTPYSSFQSSFVNAAFKIIPQFDFAQFFFIHFFDHSFDLQINLLHPEIEEADIFCFHFPGSPSKLHTYNFIIHIQPSPRSMAHSRHKRMQS